MMHNPILAFSARRRMRTLRTPALLTLYALVLAAAAYFFVYQPFMGSTITMNDMRASVEGYAVLLILQFGLLILVAPAMTSGTISGERERQTLDLLLVTNTGTFRVVTGKLLESLGFLALLVLCSLPMLSLVLLTGGASMGQILVSILFLLLTALAALSVGMFCSSLFKRTVTATVVSYLTVFGIGILTLIPLFYDVERIGQLYDAMNIAGQKLHMIDYTPISFTLNPGLGLFSLLNTQTSVFGNALWGVSHTLSTTMEWLMFDRFLVCNMLFMFAASAVLIILSAMNLRPRHSRPHGHRKD